MTKQKRLAVIAVRAQYAARRAGEFMVMGSTARDLDDEDIAERRRIGAQAGAQWVARRRGLL